MLILVYTFKNMDTMLWYNTRQSWTQNTGLESSQFSQLCSKWRQQQNESTDNSRRPHFSRYVHVNWRPNSSFILCVRQQMRWNSVIKTLTNKQKQKSRQKKRWTGSVKEPPTNFRLVCLLTALQQNQQKSSWQKQQQFDFHSQIM